MSAEPLVFTLTGNLLAERTLEFDRWLPGTTQRARAESFQVGGKGINVTKMPTRLGCPSTALCFTDAPAVRAGADFLDAQPDGQVLAICGNLPGWIARIMSRCGWRSSDGSRAVRSSWTRMGHPWFGSWSVPSPRLK